MRKLVFEPASDVLRGVLKARHHAGAVALARSPPDRRADRRAVRTTTRPDRRERPEPAGRSAAASRCRFAIVQPAARTRASCSSNRTVQRRRSAFPTPWTIAPTCWHARRQRAFAWRWCRCRRTVAGSRRHRPAFLQRACMSPHILAEIGADPARAGQVFRVRGGSPILAGPAAGQVRVAAVTAASRHAALAARRAGRRLLHLHLELVWDASRIDPFFTAIGFKFRPGCFTNDCAPPLDGRPPDAGPADRLPRQGLRLVPPHADGGDGRARARLADDERGRSRSGAHRSASPRPPTSCRTTRTV